MADTLTDMGLPTREAEINMLGQMIVASWIQHPEWRLGQLVSNITDLRDRDVFHLQDQELLEGLAHELGLEKTDD